MRIDKFCLNCNYVGPVYGIPTSAGLSAPFCPNCKLGNALIDPIVYLRDLNSNKGQTRKGSALESVFNIIVGFGISFGCNMIIFPWFGFKCSVGSALGIGAIFTLVSFVRSYVLRRLFNWIMIRWGL